ncbi:MAG: GtrA family protein [Clostridia bacterium]
MPKFIDKKTIKFIIVGILNTIVGTSVMFISYNFLGLTYWISSALNYIIGSIFSFFMNKYFTFSNSEKSLKQVVLFILNISLCYFMAYGISKPLVSYVLSGFGTSIQENIAMLCGMCLFVALNYFGQRFIVFKNQD